MQRITYFPTSTFVPSIQ